MSDNAAPNHSTRSVCRINKHFQNTDVYLGAHESGSENYFFFFFNWRGGDSLKRNT